MIDGTEKPIIPSKFAKPTARYNEFRYKCLLFLPTKSAIFIAIVKASRDASKLVGIHSAKRL